MELDNFNELGTHISKVALDERLQHLEMCVSRLH
jgi:hypothetical protein